MLNKLLKYLKKTLNDIQYSKIKLFIKNEMNNCSQNDSISSILLTTNRNSNSDNNNKDTNNIDSKNTELPSSTKNKSIVLFYDIASDSDRKCKIPPITINIESDTSYKNNKNFHNEPIDKDEHNKKISRTIEKKIDDENPSIPNNDKYNLSEKRFSHRDLNSLFTITKKNNLNLKNSIKTQSNSKSNIIAKSNEEEVEKDEIDTPDKLINNKKLNNITNIVHIHRPVLSSENINNNNNDEQDKKIENKKKSHNLKNLAGKIRTNLIINEGQPILNQKLLSKINLETNTNVNTKQSKPKNNGGTNKHSVSKNKIRSNHIAKGNFTNQMSQRSKTNSSTTRSKNNTINNTNSLTQSIKKPNNHSNNLKATNHFADYKHNTNTICSASSHMSNAKKQTSPNATGQRGQIEKRINSYNTVSTNASNKSKQFIATIKNSSSNTNTNTNTNTNANTNTNNNTNTNTNNPSNLHSKLKTNSDILKKATAKLNKTNLESIKGSARPSGKYIIKDLNMKKEYDKSHLIKKTKEERILNKHNNNYSTRSHGIANSKKESKERKESKEQQQPQKETKNVNTNTNTNTNNNNNETNTNIENKEIKDTLKINIDSYDNEQSEINIEDKMSNNGNSQNCGKGLNLKKMTNHLSKSKNIKNEEMLKQIKSTLDDNLKGLFNFSYENFLSKESETESKMSSQHEIINDDQSLNNQ